jgi:hypothetical protein
VNSHSYQNLLLLLALQSLVDLSLFQNSVFTILEAAQQNMYFMGGVVIPTPKPQPGGPGHLFFVWIITFDLYCMVGPPINYATVSVALKII